MKASDDCGQLRMVLWSDEIAPVHKLLCDLLEIYSEWEVCAESASIIDTLRKARELNPDLIVLSSQYNGRAFQSARIVLNQFPKLPILLCTVFEKIPLCLNLPHIIPVRRTPAEIGKMVAALERMQRRSFFRH